MEPLYRNDFEQADIGSLPDDLLVLEGEFKVEEMDGNKVLVLPGHPLSTFGVLFGPSKAEDIAVSARFKTRASRRRFSSFGVGLGGVSGYHLRCSPSKDAIEFLREEEVVSSAPFKWKPDLWTGLTMRIVRGETGTWKAQGKCWQEGQREPADWLITLELKNQPIAGQASIWGIPYASQPILFDDLTVRAVADGHHHRASPGTTATQPSQP